MPMLAPSTHFVCFYFLQLHFRGHFHENFRISTPAFICGRTVVLTVLDVYIRLYSTPILCERTMVSTVPDVCRHLYSTPTLICGRTAVSTVPDVCRHLYSTPTLISGRTAVSTHVSTCLISTFYTSYLLLHLRLSV